MTQPASLFQSEAWFALWAEAFGEPGYGVFRHANVAEGPAIAYVRRRASVFGLPVWVAQSATNDHSPRYDAISGSASLEALDAMIRELRVGGLALHGLPREGNLLARWQDIAAEPRVHVAPTEDAPFVDCTLPWDAYWAARGRNLRGTLSSIEKRLAGERVEMSALTEWNDIEPQLPAVYAIEASGWKGRNGSAIAQNPAQKSFYDRMIREFARNGFIRLHLLRVNDEAIAFELDTLYNGVLTGLKGGYTESHAKLSPGQLLRYRFLPPAFADPAVRTYDMLGPASETKLRWATASETLHTLRVFARSPAGAWLRARYVTAPAAKAATRRMTARLRKETPA